MRSFNRIGLIKVIVVALATLFVAPATAGDPVAIIISKSNKVDSISLIELAKIFRGQKVKWKDGQEILVVNRDIKSAEREIFYKKVLNREPTAKFYQKGTRIPVKTIVQGSPLAAKKFVSRVPNAITYLPLKDVDNKVKVLKIDDKLPNEAGYPIK